MTYLLRLKIEQCYSFRAALRTSAGSRIYHSTYKDNDVFWCTGLDFRDLQGHKQGDYPGLNYFGNLLEEFRSVLKDEADYTRDTDVRILDGIAYILYDGENLENEQSVFRSRGKW